MIQYGLASLIKCTYFFRSRGEKHGGQKMTKISGMAVISLYLGSVRNMVWLNDKETGRVAV